MWQKDKEAQFIYVTQRIVIQNAYNRHQLSAAMKVEFSTKQLLYFTTSL